MSNCQFASEQLHKVLTRIRKACLNAGREPSKVRLVGASKKQTPHLIAEFLNNGLQNLGENYLQEALEKQQALADFTVEWHFIGHIQSNKTKHLAQHFTWIHGVDRLKVAHRLSTQNPKTEPLKILLQLNVDNEASKSGISPSEAPELCAQISELPGVQLRGFMLIPMARELEVEQKAVFANARNLLETTNQHYGLSMDQLSMGMSGDLETAIAEGSTMVRIGTDLFGPRG